MQLSLILKRFINILFPNLGKTFVIVLQFSSSRLCLVWGYKSILILFEEQIARKATGATTVSATMFFAAKVSD